jgi:FemAB-related protein (PEP-CTERM system-associated)
MINVRHASPSDQARWDAFVQHHPHAQLAHPFAWHGFLSSTMRIKPIYWIAEQDQDVVGIAPFFLRSHLGLGKRLTSMPYLNTGGILAAGSQARDAIWQTVSEWAVENQVDAVELRNRFDSLPTFEIRHGRTASIIDLPPTEEQAWGQMRSTARNRIRKAQEAGLTAQIGFEHFEGFWGAYTENMRALGAPVLHRRWFLRMAVTPALNAHLITLKYQGDIVAGMVLMDFKDGTENGWTSSTVAARALYCNDLLYWEAIRWAIRRGLRWLDLGRSQSGGGHERFKEKFGARTIDLPYQEIHRSGTAWQSVTAEPEGLYRAFTTVWKRLPLPLATLAGPYFSRQIY